MDFEVVSRDGAVMVVLESLGEGLDGDYDDEDPGDRPLLRFSVYRSYAKGEAVEAGFSDDQVDGGPAHEAGWQAVSHCSYCTLLGEDDPPEAHRRAAELILARVEDAVRRQDRACVRICEDLSWVSAATVTPA